MTIFMSFQGFTEKITAGSARFAPAVSTRTWVRSPPLSNRQMLKVGERAGRLYHTGCKIRIHGCVRKGGRAHAEAARRPFAARRRGFNVVSAEVSSRPSCE